MQVPAQRARSACRVLLQKSEEKAQSWDFCQQRRFQRSMAKLEFLRISRRGSFCLDKTPVLASLAALEPPRSLTDWLAHSLTDCTDWKRFWSQNWKRYRTKSYENQRKLVQERFAAQEIELFGHMQFFWRFGSCSPVFTHCLSARWFSKL